METTDILESKLSDLQITENTKSYFKTTSTWTMFFAVICFIAIVFMILSGITTLASGSFLSSFNEFGYPGMSNLFSSISIFIGIFYIIMGIIMIFPALYLYRYAKNITNALTRNDSPSLENAIQNMKSYWKFTGILAIVCIALCIICIPIMLLLAASMI